MQDYRLNWTEHVGYYVDVKAKSAKNALAMLEAGETDECQPCGFCEIERDSIEVTRLDVAGNPIDDPLIYYVYWDSSCQVELARGSEEEMIAFDKDGILGGGNYNIYPCMTGDKIIEVIARSEKGGHGLRFVFEEEKA